MAKNDQEFVTGQYFVLMPNNWRNDWSWGEHGANMWMIESVPFSPPSTLGTHSTFHLYMRLSLDMIFPDPRYPEGLREILALDRTENRPCPVFSIANLRASHTRPFHPLWPPSSFAVQTEFSQINTQQWLPCLNSLLTQIYVVQFSILPCPRSFHIALNLVFPSATVSMPNPFFSRLLYLSLHVSISCLFPAISTP